ncbi:MAG: hypothetical protein OXF26_06305 [Alphaproteobacteria bacterium]|nr:hypothetical protein [Alphaproteobacteria bacterium]MCY4192560.1 hypothetical protein [Rhodospirillaceae bacterium]MCY4230487.1 hypothetical protein [Alphaproteobacteria bacterium]
MESSRSSGQHRLGNDLEPKGVVATIVYCAAVMFILFRVLDKLISLRVDEPAEMLGRGLSFHGEQGYNH